MPMTYDVVCLRPEEDFLRVGIVPPETLSVAYLSPEDQQLAATMTQARALVIPAVGPKLEPSLFDNCSIELIQVTGAGVVAIYTKVGKPFHVITKIVMRMKNWFNYLPV